MKLTAKQRAIVDHMKKGCPFVWFYNGPHGAEGARHRGVGWEYAMGWNVNAPKPDGRSINALIDKGVLVHIGDNEYALK